MKKFILVILLFSSGKFAQAQTSLKDILIGVQKTYHSSEGVSMDFTITMGSVNNKSDWETETGKIIIKGTNIYYKMGTSEFFVNNGLSLTVDHEEKFLILDSSINNSVEIPMLQSMTADSLNKLLGGGKVERIGNGKWKITEFTSGILHHSEMVIDSATFLIEKMAVYYRTEEGGSAEEFMQITYRNTHKGNILDTSFSISKYYRKDKDNKWVLQPAFSTYEEFHKP
ncbi:MAG: hypothetical protein H6607_09510 [Flavobacteriales bacterium]|nr:hypothetical protein [Flavobacteriales bacterium]